MKKCQNIEQALLGQKIISIDRPIDGDYYKQLN